MSKKKWFYVDIETRSHMRIAVKAYDAESAQGFATDLVEHGEIHPTEVSDYRHGGSFETIAVGDVAKGGEDIPSEMYRFEVPTGPLAFE